MKTKILIYLPFILIGTIFLNEDEPLKDEFDQNSFFISVDDSKETMFDSWIRTGIDTQGLMRLKESASESREF